MVAAQAEKKQTTSPIDVGTAPMASGFQALELPKSSDTSQALKASEGSRLTEPFRVAGALAGSVFKAAYAMYDNARTEIRVANAAKEMEKFDPAQIATGASANEILNAWTKMAERNEIVTHQMKALGGAAGTIVSKTLDEVTKLRENIDNALSKQIGDNTLVTLRGSEGAKLVSSLSSDQKREFLKAYDELRTNLGELDSIAQKATDQAKAFYEHSMKPFVKYHEFMRTKLDSDAHKHYSDSCKEIHKTHLDSLQAATTPEQIKAAGEAATEALESLQERVQSLSTSLIKANTETAKVEQTLKYLTDGVDGNTGVGASDKSVVFVSANAAEKIADWVKAQTNEAREKLTEAKKHNDPAAIAEATETLAAASQAVHKQLDDVAALLSKLNAGKDVANKDTEGVRERIIAKASEHGVQTKEISKPLTSYISALNGKMDSVVADMFKDPTNKSVGTGELKKFVALHHDRVEHMIARDASDGLTAGEVKKALKLAEEALTEKPAPTKDKVDVAAEKYNRLVAKRVDEMEKQPKQSFLSRFRSWFVNN